jgi:hypothetical protein
MTIGTGTASDSSFHRDFSCLETIHGRRLADRANPFETSGLPPVDGVKKSLSNPADLFCGIGNQTSPRNKGPLLRISSEIGLNTMHSALGWLVAIIVVFPRMQDQSSEPLNTLKNRLFTCIQLRPSLMHIFHEDLRRRAGIVPNSSQKILSRLPYDSNAKIRHKNYSNQ